jgi:hypothetical protein
MAKFRIPGYCIHTAKKQAYVRLGGEMIYLGTPGSPESRAKYDRLIAEWMASGRTYVKPAEREGISVNEVLLAYRCFAEPTLASMAETVRMRVIGWDYRPDEDK